jgi:hypothetical protein
MALNQYGSSNRKRGYRFGADSHRSGIARQATRALLAQLVRIGQHDLRLPVVVADWPCHTDALAKKGGLWVPEFRPIHTIANSGEDGARIQLPEVKQRRLGSYSPEATTPQTVAISPM